MNVSTGPAAFLPRCQTRMNLPRVADVCSPIPIKYHQVGKAAQYRALDLEIDDQLELDGALCREGHDHFT
jgi:hypothetical protein